MFATDVYKKQLYTQHNKNKGWGHGASNDKFKKFKNFLEEQECKTIIDYGSGKSNLKGFVEKNYDYEVTEYDIGIVGIDILKSKADFIVCVDVLEHIERVVHHVTRLEQSAETAVQMHFNIQSNHNNDVMKTLTALTAIFLPLNLITGFFGMNFENFPFIKTEDGLLLTEIFMALLALILVVYFWTNRIFTSNLNKKRM